MLNKHRSQGVAEEAADYGSYSDADWGRPTRRRKHIVRFVLRRVALAFALVVVAYTAMVVYSGVRLYMSYTNVKSSMSVLKDGLKDGNEEKLSKGSEDISKSVSAIHDQFEGPVWQVASVFPLVGQDVKNVRTLVSCADDLCANALVPACAQLSGTKFSDLVEDSRINTAVLDSLHDAVDEVAPVVVKNANTIALIQPGSVTRLNNAIQEMQDVFHAMGGALEDTDGFFTALLGMLGGDGNARSYVVLAQQNSEIRAGGGFPGAWGIITVADGHIEMQEFSSIYDIKEIIEPENFHATITEEELDAFGSVFSGDAAGCTLTPDFERAGEIASQNWEHATGERVDGVIALDPVFLQRMLALTEGITASDGTKVDGTNAAFELMCNVYWRYAGEKNANDKEDAFFSDVAKKAFNKFVGDMGGVNGFDLLSTVVASGRDHRLQMWMHNSNEEHVIRTLGLSGAMQDDLTRPEICLFANDNTWAKITWYLDIYADIDEGVYNNNGTVSYNCTAHFVNNMTPEEAEEAPRYVTGSNPLKRDKGDMVETIYIMAPLDGSISNYQVHQDEPVDVEDTIPDEQLSLYGLDTYRSRINIKAGNETTVTFCVTIPDWIQVKPTIRTSPLAQDK